MSEPCPACGRATWTPEELRERFAGTAKQVKAIRASIMAEPVPVKITSKLVLGSKELNLVVAEVNRQAARGGVARNPPRIWRLGRFSLTYRPK